MRRGPIGPRLSGATVERAFGTLWHVPDFLRPEYDTDELGVFGDLLELVRAGAPSWHADALCREYPSVDFFPAVGARATEAKAVCGRCLVQRECRSWSLEQGPELDGVFGGLTQRDRAKLRREKRGRRAA